MRRSVQCNFLLLFFLVSGPLAYAQINISGYIKSKEDQTPVPYAMIINKTSGRHGTTSKKDGSFSITLPEGSESHELYFSSLGFKDVVYQVKDLIKPNMVIYLEVEPYILPEVVVDDFDKGSLGSYGDANLPLKPVSGDGTDEELRFESAGKGYGVFVEPRKKDKGLFQSIEIYLTPNGVPETPLGVRILVPQVKMKNAKMEPLSNFRDILTEPVILEPRGAGWNEVNVEDMNIPVPKGKFLVIFYTLDQGSQNSWSQNEQEYYGSCIGIYKSPEVPHIFAARQVRGGTHFAFLKPFGVNNFNIPAIVINYFKKKN